VAPPTGPTPERGTGTSSRRGRSDAGQVVAYVVLAYLLSWTVWIPLAAQHVTVSTGQGWPTHLLGLMGPAVAALLVTAVTGGRTGLADLWARITRWRVRWLWYAVIAGTAALALLPVVAGAESGIDGVGRYSGAPAVGVWVVPYVLLVNGFGEEIGWRGFLAEHLLQRRSRAVSALVVWPIWAAWHLPLFWIVGNFRDFGVGGTIGWVVGIGFGSVVLTWLYASAARSILVVALWHTAYNFATATEAAAGVAAAVTSALVIIGSVVILRRPRTWQVPQT
jgi:CAAX protease family protein